MTLPVSSYEDLLARVRSLTHQTIQLQRELTNPLVDHNDNDRSLTTSACRDVISTCDNGKRGVASAGWTTPTTSQLHLHQAGPAAGEPDHHRPPNSVTHRRPASAPSVGDSSSSTAGDVRGWSRKSARSSRSDTYHLQNGSVSNEEFTAASVLARLGVTIDAQGGLVRERPSSLLPGGLVINNKENVMEEPKEEDEKKTTEQQCGTKSNDDDNMSAEDGEDDAGGDSKMTNSGTQTLQGVEATEAQNLSTLYHGTWPVERSLWHSGPSSIGGNSGSRSITQDVSSVMSFTSSVGSGCLLPEEVAAARRTYSQQQLGAKVEMVYSLLSMLGTHDREDMSRTLLAMSSSPDSCVAMRQSGCLPLLVQLLHAPDSDSETRQRASKALHNMVHSHPDDKRGRREARVLRLLEQVREYCESLREMIDAVTPAESTQDTHSPTLQAATRIDEELLLKVLRGSEKELGFVGQDSSCSLVLDDMERHPGPTIAALMKLSFDEEHRHAMCQLGGLHAVAELIQVDHEAHGSTTNDQYCVTLRRYAGMALTNLTFGDGANKALLCSFRQFMKALVAQLKSPSEDLRQVTASVLRNLSWRADGASKQTLREVGAVTGLMQAAMEGKKESTLKSILSALWNLSAHCSVNKVDICAVVGALGFLVDMLSYKAPSKTLAIVENAGGILRNISSHIAVREDYREILREHNCLQVLLQQLKSPSLTIVSNACGTLWNLSARCADDQRALWEMGAVSMLRSLVHSKHKMISMGSSAALKNLLSAKPNNNFPPLDSTAKGLGLPTLPSLYVRKQRALEQELDQTLSETCDNIEPSTSPSSSTIGLRDEKFVFSTTERRHSRMHHSQVYQHHQMTKYNSRGAVARSDSRDSVTSTLSDTVYERVSRTVINPFSYTQISPTNGAAQGLTGSLSDSGRINSQMTGGEISDRRFLRRYCNSMREREESRKLTSLDVSNEDNIQHTRLGQISETTFSDVSESHNVTTDGNVGSHQSSIDNHHDTNTSIEAVDNTAQLEPVLSKSSSLAKQSSNVHYECPTSAYSSPATAYITSPIRTQYQQQNCVDTTYSSARTKFSDYAYEDAEAQEQLVDYSLKYVEDNAQNREVEVEEIESSRTKSEDNRSVNYSASGNNNALRGKQNQNDLGRGYPYRHQGNVHMSKNMKMNVGYGDYAETDLDQPTNYSLKYAEQDEETEFGKNQTGERERSDRNYYDGTVPMHEDTLKTYCTEGTPYETPYNFSTATSLSDLHCEPLVPHSEDNVAKKQTENYTKEESVVEDTSKGINESEIPNPKDASNFDKDFEDKGPQMKALPPAPRQPLKRLQSGLSSGLMSPEKPIQYCEEGTPGCFSRVSSLSSFTVSSNMDNAIQSPLPSNQTSDLQEELKTEINGVDAPSEVVVKTEPENEKNTGEEACGHAEEDMKEEQQRGDREGKVVTFGGADHYAEETPLMFSRCSSLGSLSSFEQHSIHDDRSSVVSDFSRLTSGIVSPSELPDSPSQTVPTSPRHSKPPVEFTNRLIEENGAVRTQPIPANRHQESEPTVKGSVFEDNVVAFEEEDTPVEFSRATSLSSLTIDDEPKISNDEMLKEILSKASSSHIRPSNIPTGIHHRMDLVGRERDEGMEKQDVEKEKRGELADCCELAPVSEGEEENDEDMLAACINIGMQNSRQRQCQYNKHAQAQTNQPTGAGNGSRLPVTVQTNLQRGGRPSGIPVKTTPNNNLKQGKATNQPRQEVITARGSSAKPVTYMEVSGGACEDAVRTYCTEGTPANISHAGSHSDLSVQSLLGDGDVIEVQREETRLEEVDEVEGGTSNTDREVDRPELSDDSSNFSGDNDNILAECIQSGMPKARTQTSRRVLPQPGSISSSEKIPTVVPGVTVCVLPPRRPLVSTYRPPTHHLCSLNHGSPSHSPPRPINKKPAASQCSPRPKSTIQDPAKQKVSSQEIVDQHTASSTDTKLSGVLQEAQCLAAKDELETYATEGSPNMFSIRSSLTDLTINSNDGITGTVQRESGSQAVSEGAPCDPLRFNAEDQLEISHAASYSSLNAGEEEEFNTGIKSPHPSIAGHHAAGSAQPSGIPVLVSQSSSRSRRACMSPLNKVVDSLSSETAAQLMVASDGSWGDHSDKHEDSSSSRLHNKTSSISEDVVTVLSRNGSLSSLSVDSFGSTEPTPSEQALLEQCISSGMPKSKSENVGGKFRITVPVNSKEKVVGGLCKIPIATEHLRQSDEERQGAAIQNISMQKFDVKSFTRTHCTDYHDVGVLENGVACMSLQGEGNVYYNYEIKQVPKNGVDLSAALSMKEIAVDIEGNVAVTGSEQNHLDHLESKEFQENEGNLIGQNDVGSLKKQFDIELIDNTSSQNHKVDSSHDSTSDDNKSPFSSGESLSPDDGKLENCDKKRKDPDAMIASLDRLTEELVHQAQDMHLKRERSRDSNIMKQSLVGSDTWNEDTSPNDVSFPSMSISAPLVSSFRSDNHEDAASALPELAEEADLISKASEHQGSSLTDSHMIEVEAEKLAAAVQVEGQNLPYTSAEEMEHSLTSLNSIDLDAIKPPSMMGSLVSLTASLSGQLDNGENGDSRDRCNSSSLPPHQPRSNGNRLECRHSRKKSLPAGMMVRRALGNNHNGSIENLQDNTSVSSSCNSHLDNIKPPSAMEELIDIVDMENSMVSVASITSEVADSSTKEQTNSEQSPGNSDALFELLKPAANVMAEVYAAQYPAAAMSTSVRTNSASDCLDNINPPSAFNEVADLADPESMLEPGTETICSDTELYTEEPGYAQSMEKLHEDVPDLPSDNSRKATPVPSDHATSSAESTPKKHRNKHLTPKQKRQLVKERYKTYTITGEEENNEETTKKENHEKMFPAEIDETETYKVDTESLQEEEKDLKDRNHIRITPKQRRLEDRQRFQTRVLDKSPAVESKPEEIQDTSENTDDLKIMPDKNMHSSEQLDIKNVDVMSQKVSRIKTLKQKRAEAKERFRTRTLSEENKVQQTPDVNNDNFNEAAESVSYETRECLPKTLGTETLSLNCSEVGFVEAFLNVTPEEIESLLERDANIVITTLNDSRRRNSESSELPSSDEMLLECETLSLISIESESDQNSNFCRTGRRYGSDYIAREMSVTEVSGAQNVFETNMEVNRNEDVTLKTDDKELSAEESEESQDEENDENASKLRGPRIVKPEGRFKRDESADSNQTDEGTPQTNSPKSIRGRRKALYSSPSSKKATLQSSGLPISPKARSSIPICSGPAKTGSSNVRPTRASALRQTGRSSSISTPQRSISRTPPSSAESRSPRNTSPKTKVKLHQRNSSNSSPPTKALSRNSSSLTRTPRKGSTELEQKDARFKPPERQGTFTKEDGITALANKAAPPPSPTKTRIPVAASITNNINTKFESKLKKPIKSSSSANVSSSKSKTHKENSVPFTRSITQTRFTKTHSQENNVSSKVNLNNPKTLVKAATMPGRMQSTQSPPFSRTSYKGMKTSLSNQSLQSSDSGKATPKQGVVQPQRSNSNCSLNSVTSGGSGGKKSNTKKEVTSKIASLWKKVEESKNKQKIAKKDTRVWITATPTESVDAEVDSHEVPPEITPTSKLVRSSTFEGLPSKLTSNDISEQATTGVTNASKTKIAMRFSKISVRTDTKNIVHADQEPSSRLPSTQRQVTEVTRVVVVHPSRVLDSLASKKGDEEIPVQEVVLRRQRNETKSNEFDNEEADPDNPKRLSRLGSFIRIDSPEEGSVSTGDGKNPSKPQASAIVQPFNYSPPTVTSHIPTPITSIAKRSESYLSGIGNVEAVRHDQTEVIDEFSTASMRVTTV